jgi:methylaspartate mutase sigma subunit
MRQQTDRPSTNPAPGTRTVILGVAASDSHVVANQLIAHALRARGFHVVNLGACTTIAEFAQAHADHPRAEAVIIGSLNGHAHEDLRGIAEARREGLLNCPVIVGGNLSVGSHKDAGNTDRIYALGVDVVLHDPDLLPATLDALRDGAAARTAPAPSFAAS